MILIYYNRILILVDISDPELDVQINNYPKLLHYNTICFSTLYRLYYACVETSFILMEIELLFLSTLKNYFN